VCAHKNKINLSRLKEHIGIVFDRLIETILQERYREKESPSDNRTQLRDNELRLASFVPHEVMVGYLQRVPQASQAKQQ
jgi:tRNA U34 5-carboxymethylaminomethyl modifying enzyme MnmG/GidA